MSTSWPGRQVPEAEALQKHDGMDPILLSQHMTLTTALPSVAYEYGRNHFLYGSHQPQQPQHPMPVEAVLRCQETGLLHSSNMSGGEAVSPKAHVKDSISHLSSSRLLHPLDVANSMLPLPNTGSRHSLIDVPLHNNLLTTSSPNSQTDTLHLHQSANSTTRIGRAHNMPGNCSDENKSSDGGNIHHVDSRYVMDCGADGKHRTTPQTPPPNHHNHHSIGGECRDLNSSSSDHRFSKGNILWQAISVNSPDYQPSSLTFSFSTGPVNATSNDSPLEIFRRIFDAKLVEMIILEINRFGRKIMSEEITVGPKKKKIKTEGMLQTGKQSSCKKRTTEWLDTDVVEFWSLLAVLFYMSVVKIPTIKRYWNKELWGQPTVQSLMKRDRFCMLLRCLEFADQHDPNSSDNTNIARITPLLSKMSSNFRREYRSDCQLNLTETMVQSNGKNKCKSLITEENKPLAIRSYILCEAKTGYVLDFFVHSGKSTPYHSNLGLKYDSTRTSELAACKLLDNFQGKGHVLFTDCYYSSPQLFAFLRSYAGIDCVGLTHPTVDGFPDSIKPTNTHIGKGEVVNMMSRIYSASLLAQTWRLKDEGSPKFVSLLSTKHSPATKVVAQKNKGYLHKPVSYLEFSEYSGGIEKADQTSMLFPGEEGPATKYPYKVFLRFVHLALHNAYVIWRSFDPKPILGYGTNFRLQLVKELKHEADTLKQRSSPGLSAPNSPSEQIYSVAPQRRPHPSAAGGHALTRTASMANNIKRRSRRRCAHCWNASFKRSQTTYECKLCNQGYCPPCFDEYHGKMKSVS